MKFSFGDKATWVDRRFPDKGKLKAVVTQAYGEDQYGLAVLEERFKWQHSSFESYTPGRSVSEDELIEGWGQ